MTLGTIIGGISLALIVLAFAICAAAGRADEEAEILERRLRAMEPPLEPDFAGNVVAFRKAGAL